MRRIYDCFLYNDERELLALRLRLLVSRIHKFVVVWSRETFTGLKKAGSPPYDLLDCPEFVGKVEFIELETLVGRTPWEKEAFSRNALSRGVAGAQSSDLIMVSDVDEIPRPSVLTELADRAPDDHPVVLAQDYFNFKFNYKLVHGLQAVWAGPVLSASRNAGSPQELRNQRWLLLEESHCCVDDGGWHFSYLSVAGDISAKLASFSHQERIVQRRGAERADALIGRHEGFHDHLYAGSVWAAVPLETYRCSELKDLISEHPELVATVGIDEEDRANRAVKHSMRRLYHSELAKIITWHRWTDIAAELLSRIGRRLVRAIHWNLS